jgi:diguanylate cyclase (GGDEF)-like protein
MQLANLRDVRLMSAADAATIGLRSGELELVVSISDGSTVFANAPALAHAQACGLEEACVAELCVFASRDEHDRVLEWVRSGVDGAITVLLRQHIGPPLLTALTLRALRSSANDAVTTVSLRFSEMAGGHSTEPRSDASSGSRDALTGLLGRADLLNALQTALLAETELAVLFADMDHFKRVNDTRGHHAGDQLLIQFAERLRGAAPDGVIARFGGDEFVVVLPSTTAEAVEVCVRSILDATARPFALDNADVTVSASVGVALIGPTERDRNVDRLLREADIALFEAKRLGRGRAQSFTPQLRLQFDERVKLEDALRVALERRELRVEYQPQVDLRTGRVVSNEALARWNHDGVDIPPDHFIPIAEETGMINELGRQVLDAACRQHAQWRQALEHPR